LAPTAEETEEMPHPPVTPPFDPARLADFLTRQLGTKGEMRLEPIAGGQSNPTYFVTFDDRRLVLRKQPDGPVLPSAHAVDREYRVLAALAASAVPVPPVLLYHGERDIVGTPFYIMARIEGRVFAESMMAGANAAERGAMFRSVAETLAALHDVDWRAVGLEGFGRPGNYFQRQISRWTRQWEGERFRDIPDLSRLAAWLAANIPDDDTTTLCHGDFRIGNLMFHPTEPRVVAVLDWELATLGHPLADLAFSALAWRSRPEEYGGLKGLDLAALGIPSEAEYLAHYYRSRRGPAPPLQPFHTAFALFRFAVIFEGIAARARRGTAASANAAAVGNLSLAFARLGAALIPG
jgi:aminoglycoside phosphotransferase (APT) family kinase protein